MSPNPHKNPPFINPKDCPGKLIEWFNKAREEDKKERDDYFEKHLIIPSQKFFPMVATNRLWLQLFTLVFAVFASIITPTIYNLRKEVYYEKIRSEIKDETNPEIYLNSKRTQVSPHAVFPEPNSQSNGDILFLRDY